MYRVRQLFQGWCRTCKCLEGQLETHALTMLLRRHTGAPPRETHSQPKCSIHKKIAQFLAVLAPPEYQWSAACDRVLWRSILDPLGSSSTCMSPTARLEFWGTPQAQGDLGKLIVLAPGIL